MKLPWQRRRGPRHPAEWIVVGLGNPGQEYAGTRHNIGHRVVAELARRAGVRPRPAGRSVAIATARLGGRVVALVRSRTFMNESGKAVREALRLTGGELERTIVIHDDLDLAVGALRLRRGGGHGGNRGMKSIVAEVGADLVRVRIGIGRPEVDGEPSWEPEVVSGWVLSRPSPEERRRLDEAVVRAADAVVCILSEGLDVAASRFNRR